MLKKAILLLTIIGLVGCASKNAYVAPTAGPISTLKGYHERNGLFDWREAYVTAIDDKEISYMQEDMIGGFKGNKVVNVMPGKHVFVINTIFNREFLGNGPYETYLEITTSLAPNNSYHLGMSVHGATVSSWIQDQSGKKVSAVVSNSYRTVPRVNAVYIPPSR